MAEEKKTKKKRKKTTITTEPAESTTVGEYVNAGESGVVVVAEIAPIIVDKPKKSKSEALYNEFFNGVLPGHNFTTILRRAQTIEVDIDSFDNVVITMPGFGSHIVQKYFTEELGDRYVFERLDHQRITVERKE